MRRKIQFLAAAKPGTWELTLPQFVPQQKAVGNPVFSKNTLFTTLCLFM
jgi:hypothetical protein